MVSEKENMLTGQLYDASDAELVEMRLRARRLTREFNLSGPDDTAERTRLLERLFGEFGEQTHVEPPFYCDYGCYVFLGKQVYMNFNCVILDCNTVRIGDQTQLGPNVTISAATHPLNAADRVKGPELARPVTLGKRVWIGAGAIIGSGVTIGDDTTVGAGSIVVKDLPAGVLAVGNPCKVIRPLE